MVQAEQIKTREAEAKLASFTGTLQQRLLQLATEVSCALHAETRTAAVHISHRLENAAARSAMSLYFPRNRFWHCCFHREDRGNLIYTLDITLMIRCLA